MRRRVARTMPAHFSSPIVLIGLLLLGAAESATGCGFHPAFEEVRLDSMYPGSLAVAVALRNAADQGVVDASTLEALGNGTASYDDTVRRLQEFQRILATSSVAGELPRSFSLGYVESQLWTRYSQTDGAVAVEVHTEGPLEGEAVVLTGEPVLTDVLAGRLSLDRALAEGLIVIEGSTSARVSILQALNATAPTNRISRR